MFSCALRPLVDIINRCTVKVSETIQYDFYSFCCLTSFGSFVEFSQIPELLERTAVSAEPSPVASEAVLPMNEVMDDAPPPPQMTAAPVAAAVVEEVVAPSPVQLKTEEELEAKKEPEKETLPQGNCMYLVVTLNM